MRSSDIRQTTIKVLIIIFAASLLLIKPFFHRRDAVKVAIRTLEAWKSGDSLAAYSQFENEKESPPIYSLSSYKITKKVFDKKGDKNHASFYVVLNFPSDSLFASGKEWVFELTDTGLVGWKITNVYEAQEKSIPRSL